MAVAGNGDTRGYLQRSPRQLLRRRPRRWQRLPWQLSPAEPQAIAPPAPPALATATPEAISREVPGNCPAGAAWRPTLSSRALNGTTSGTQKVITFYGILSAGVMENSPRSTPELDIAQLAGALRRAAIPMPAACRGVHDAHDFVAEGEQPRHPRRAQDVLRMHRKGQPCA